VGDARGDAGSTHARGSAPRDCRGEDAGERRLWRLRVTVAEEPGALERLTAALAHLDANILALHVHPLAGGARDDLVLAVPERVSSLVLLDAVEDGGGRGASLLPTSAQALADEPTRALALAARVSADPRELPAAVAELLGAHLVTDALRAPDPAWRPGSPTLLRVPSPWTAPIALARDGEPFTPAEAARASQLAALAATAVQRCECGAQPVGQALAAGAEQRGVEVVQHRVA